MQEGELTYSNDDHFYLQSELKIGDFTLIKSLDNIDSDL